VVPGWSTHDLVWHCAYWVDYAGDMLERIRGGDPDPDDSDDPEAQILAAGRRMTWDEVVQRAEQSRERVRAALSAFGDLPQRAAEWFEDDTFDHYDEHGAEIRAFIK
jgi:DinB family protein